MARRLTTIDGYQEILGSTPRRTYTFTFAPRRSLVGCINLLLDGWRKSTSMREIHLLCLFASRAVSLIVIGCQLV